MGHPFPLHWFTGQVNTDVLKQDGSLIRGVKTDLGVVTLMNVEPYADLMQHIVDWLVGESDFDKFPRSALFMVQAYFGVAFQWRPLYLLSCTFWLLSKNWCLRSIWVLTSRWVRTRKRKCGCNHRLTITIRGLEWTKVVNFRYRNCKVIYHQINVLIVC